MPPTSNSPSIGDRVARVLAAFDQPAERAARLVRWIDVVAEWNRRVDLTAARDEDELVDLMVADAALLAGCIAEARRVIDVGTGAGAPGLAIALLRPDLDMTLVEPMQKRATLLRMQMGLVKGERPDARLAVVQGRGEAITTRFDVACSRATLPPPAWLELGTRLADEVWVLLAAQDPPERAGWEVVADRAYRWPLTGASRRAVAYRPSTR